MYLLLKTRWCPDHPSRWMSCRLSKVRFRPPQYLDPHPFSSGQSYIKGSSILDGYDSVWKCSSWNCKYALTVKMYQSFFFEIKKFCNFVDVWFLSSVQDPRTFYVCKNQNARHTIKQKPIWKAIPSQLDVRRQFLAISWQAANFEVFWGAV